MPVPALVGTTVIASFVSAGLVAVVDFLARVITKKFAIVTVAIAAALLVISAFVGSMYALATQLTLALPAEFLALGGLFMPSNIDEGIAILVAGRLAKWVYVWNIRAIDWKLKATL